MERGNTGSIKFVYLGSDLVLLGVSFIIISLVVAEDIDQSIKDYQSLICHFPLNMGGFFLHYQKLSDSKNRKVSIGLSEDFIYFFPACTTDFCLFGGV